MKNINSIAFGTFVLAAVVVLSGCGQGGGGTSSEFPLTDDAKSVTQVGETLNYQTEQSLEDVAALYRQALVAQGLTERTITTVVSEDVVNLVFDGHENGKALVVQATPLGDGVVNVNVRFESI